ncbi:UNVERIFIED_CONTAM: hypothetical protein Sradi_2797500 [Sesamum radiatum]|uniref:Uncharacterized protein n=1 Tax=Sesamum radiatum TaxID=300843 RepID=A0AAW2RV08_SESRA
MQDSGEGGVSSCCVGDILHVGVGLLIGIVWRDELRQQKPEPEQEQEQKPNGSTVCAKTAKGLAILLENARTWQSVTIVVFLGILHQNAPRSLSAGTAENLATWREIVLMRASAIPVGKRDTGQRLHSSSVTSW